MQMPNVLAVLTQVHKVSTVLHKGARKVLPLIGEGQNLKVVIAPFCRSPLHVIKYQSLIPLFDILGCVVTAATWWIPQEIRCLSLD